jgi:hypothetical protein
MAAITELISPWDRAGGANKNKILFGVFSCETPKQMGQLVSTAPALVESEATLETGKGQERMAPCGLLSGLKKKQLWERAPFQLGWEG